MYWPSKSIFYIKNYSNIFLKKLFRHILLLTFSTTSIFKALYFRKSYSFFDGQSLKKSKYFLVAELETPLAKLLWPILRQESLTDRIYILTKYFEIVKGQVISKWFWGSSISSKKRTNEFVFTTMRIVFVRFLEEIDDLKKPFRN